MASSQHLSNQFANFVLGIESTPHVKILYSYGRSREARKAEQPSEDHLIYQYDSNQLIFAICDGVGQSIGADFAARYLTDQLIHFFLSVTKQEKGNHASLVNHLNLSLDLAQEYINQAPNPFYPTSRKYHFFEQHRKEGAEAKFIAGTVDFNSGDITVYSLGDLIFAAIDTAGQVLPGPNMAIGRWLRQAARKSVQPPRWENAGTWSSRHGVVNAQSLETWRYSVTNLQQISFASDGLLAMFRNTYDVKFRNSISSMLAKACRVGKDDISYLKLTFQPPSATELHQVKEWSQIGDIFRWQPVPGADGYRIILESPRGNQEFIEVKRKRHWVHIPNSDFRFLKIQAISSQFVTSSWLEVILTNMW